jgi:hypothetical protein
LDKKRFAIILAVHLDHDARRIATFMDGLHSALNQSLRVRETGPENTTVQTYNFFRFDTKHSLGGAIRAEQALIHVTKCVGDRGIVEQDTKTILGLLPAQLKTQSIKFAGNTLRQYLEYERSLRVFRYRGLAKGAYVPKYRPVLGLQLDAEVTINSTSARNMLFQTRPEKALPLAHYRFAWRSSQFVFDIVNDLAARPIGQGT